MIQVLLRRHLATGRETDNIQRYDNTGAAQAVFLKLSQIFVRLLQTNEIAHNVF